MKKGMKITVIALVFVGAGLVSCKKDHCHECHYDGPNGEVELGEKCEDEIESLEANGMEVDGTTYEVHCHGH